MQFAPDVDTAGTYRVAQAPVFTALHALPHFSYISNVSELVNITALENYAHGLAYNGAIVVGCGVLLLAIAIFMLCKRCCGCCCRISCGKHKKHSGYGGKSVSPSRVAVNFRFISSAIVVLRRSGRHTAVILALLAGIDCGICCNSGTCGTDQPHASECT